MIETALYTTSSSPDVLDRSQALPDTVLKQFAASWQDKPQAQLVEETASYCMETKRVSDPYYFSLSSRGELFSPQANCRIKDVVERSNDLGQLEYQVLQKIEEWTKNNTQGTIAWISPPSAGIYPTSKIVVSQLEEKNGQKMLLNRAIVLDINEERCLKFARDLTEFSTNRPLLSSLDHIRSNPLVLKTSGLDWTYLLEELLEDLDLRSVRDGEDKRIKNEVLSQVEKILQVQMLKTGGVDVQGMTTAITQAGLVGDYSSSCPVAFGKPTAFQVFSGSSLVSGETCQKIRCGKEGCGWEASDEDARKIARREMTCCPKCGWKPG